MSTSAGKIFFTSDWHIGHENIIRYCERPFASVDIMNQTLVDNYNAIVHPEDTCYFVGDVCMGNREINLPLFRTLNGNKILVTGNHDLVFRIHEKEKAKKHEALYRAAGFSDIQDEMIVEVPGFRKIRLYHFPYRGADKEDSKEYEVRFEEYRLEDDGILLLHGHTHQKEKVTGKHSIHVGVDAWDFKPISLKEIQDLYAKLSEND